MLLKALIFDKLQKEEWPLSTPPAPNGFKEALARNKGVFFGAPMVFGTPRTETDENIVKRRLLDDHMKEICNYIYYDDAVGRAYALLDPTEFFAMIETSCEQGIRAVQESKLISGADHYIMIAKGLETLFPRTAARISKQITKRLFSADNMDKDVKIYKRFAKRYRPIGKYRLFHRRNTNWKEYKLTLESLGHHSMEGYKHALNWRLEKGLYYDKVESLGDNFEPTVNEEDKVANLMRAGYTRGQVEECLQGSNGASYIEVLQMLQQTYPDQEAEEKIQQ